MTFDQFFEYIKDNKDPVEVWISYPDGTKQKHTLRYFESKGKMFVFDGVTQKTWEIDEETLKYAKLNKYTLA